MLVLYGDSVGLGGQVVAAAEGREQAMIVLNMVGLTLMWTGVRGRGPHLTIIM
jgi:hypothetical protein